MNLKSVFLLIFMAGGSTCYLVGSLRVYGGCLEAKVDKLSYIWAYKKKIRKMHMRKLVKEAIIYWDFCIQYKINASATLVSILQKINR
jgi:hypothetical protein